MKDRSLFRPAAPGRAGTLNGGMRKDAMGKGAMGKGAMGKGAMGKGAMGKRAMGKRSLPVQLSTLAILAFAVAMLIPVRVRAEEPIPAELSGIGVQEHLGEMVDRTLEFTDHRGQQVHLDDYFHDGKPVLLTLNYYECPSLCNLQLNGLTEGLRATGWKVGKQFRIVTVSINPRETPALADAKRKSYLDLLGQPEADWSFLVGSERNIQALASQVGFQYRYDPLQQQYAHALAIMMLAPDGMVARYLYGMDYPAWDLKFGLMEASHGRVGSPAEKLILSCFHYDPTTRGYGPFAMGIMRLGAVLMLLVMAIAGASLWRRDKTRRRLKEVHP
jgi:protein SCO1/2